MFKKLLLAAMALAVTVVGVAVFAPDTQDITATSNRTSWHTKANVTEFDGIWAGTIPPYNNTYHFFPFCFGHSDGGEVLTSAEQLLVHAAIDAWDDTIAAAVIFPTPTVCADDSDATCNHENWDAPSMPQYGIEPPIIDGVWEFVHDDNEDHDTWYGLGITCLDEEKTQTSYGKLLDCDIVLPNLDPNNNDEFLYIATHEIGHCMGLAHDCDHPSIMCYGTGETNKRTTIQTYDITGLTFIYDDWDADGCANSEEATTKTVGSNPTETFGGGRNTLKSNDFADWNGDGSVDIGDTTGYSLAHFGHATTNTWHPIDAKFDMSGTNQPPSAIGQGDGSIDLKETLTVLAQFGHQCRSGFRP